MLNLSVKAKYGLTALFELALQYKGEPEQLKTIADRHNIPHGYLEQLMIELKKDGFVKSFRGRSGGYALAREPQCITVHEILEALDGPIDLCEGHKGCQALSQFWEEKEKELSQLFNISLSELITHQQRLEKMVVYTI